jgi:type VI secretion system protein ImpJ
VEQHQKVLWTEGMFLTPQHFQQWDRHFEYLIQQRMGSVAPQAWGVREFAVNEEGLVGGEFSISKIRAVMPDGLVVDAPDTGEPPAVRAIADHFGADRERLGVYLAAPITPSGGAAHSEGGFHDGRATRYLARSLDVRDSGGHGGDKPISVASTHLRVLFEGESLDNYSWIKIAELGRTSTGGFTLVENYVPPCISIGASPYLMSTLRKILEILSAKSSEFASQRRDRGAGLASFSTSESASFWLLHTVNGAIPPLQHAFNTGTWHPEAVYLEVARLTGFMFTFAGDGHPKDTPAYAHDDLATTFSRLEARLRDLLGTVIPTKCTNIDLQTIRDNMYVAEIKDDRVLEPEGALYVAVAADVPAEKVVREAPLKFKISSRDRVDQLITAALRGISVKHIAAPPPEIPVQPGRNYFQIDKAGEHWEAVRESRSMAMYLPPEFAGLRLELMAVKE